MKKIVFSCVILFIIVYSFFFPEVMVNAARTGIQVWFHQILPALLPFTILSAVTINSNFLKSYKGNVNLVACLLTMTCGFIFGFPVGAKLTSDFYKQKLLSEKQATILAITTNNFSPMYVCGFALSLLFSSNQHNKETYLILYLIPLLIVTGYLLLRQNIVSKNIEETKKKAEYFQLDMKIMDSSIISGFETLVRICGYIVLFSIITEILKTSITSMGLHLSIPFAVILGNLEITNGIHLISKLDVNQSLKYILAIQLLSFGGLSGIAQTGSIFSKTGLSLRKYIIGKAILSLLLTLLSVIYVLVIDLF